MACPVEGCQVWIVRHTGLQVHFVYLHVRSMVVITE